MNPFAQTLWLTFKLATVTTLCLAILGIPIAYALSESRSRLKPFWEALVSLPLVLPPTVIGFYFIITFSASSPIGSWLHHNLGLRLVFSFSGLVLGSIIYSLPFMVQPIQAGFENLPVQLKEAAYTLGKNRWQTLRSILLPNIHPALVSALLLSFAHTIGEFGLVLMIGGNIPGKTRVASIAVFDQVEALNYDQANAYALILVVFSLTILTFSQALSRKLNRRPW